MTHEVSTRLRERTARIAESYGLELFDLQFRRESIGWVLRIVLDRIPTADDAANATAEGPAAEPGVSIDDCKRVSEDVSTLLDVEPDLLEAGDRQYTLEVSSPGLDRPLRDERDYRRFVGRLAKIVTREAVERQTAFAGRLAGVDNGEVLLNEGRRTHRIPLSLIARARLEVEF